MVDKQSSYQSYLLRLWVDSGTKDLVWRASLKDPLTGERRGFASLEALFAFLRQETDNLVERREAPSGDEAFDV